MPVSFVVDDMLNFVRKTRAATYDLVFSSLAVHHLQDSDKQALVAEVHRILKPNGVFILVDIFLDEDENRDHFIRAITDHIRLDWVALNSEQTESVIHHLTNFDFPSKLSNYNEWGVEISDFNSLKCFENIRFYRSIALEAQ